MLHIEGMEITRGTKNIIQESIESIEFGEQKNRNAICREFCRIVEERYTGGAMSYQLRRMGNSYPIEFLSENNWTIKDALDNGLLVYIDENLFIDKEFTIIGNEYYSIEHLAVQSKIKEHHISDLVKNINVIHLDELDKLGLRLTDQLNEFHPENVKSIKVLVPVSSETTKLLDQKLNLLTSLFGDTHSTSEILNVTKEQIRTSGLLTAITSSVKVPLDTTAPILEAIDKYLYDTTGEYQM